MAHDKVMRFDAELVDAAAAEGRRQSRSATQQLAYWVRVGRAVTASSSASQRRVEEAFAGNFPISDLSPEESAAFRAQAVARIDERLAAVDFTATLAAEGITTVALDEQGRLVETSPDGSTRVLPDRS